MPVATRPLSGSDARERTRSADSSIRVALLGCGTVGSAFAQLGQHRSHHREAAITHALVRNRRLLRPTLSSAAAVIDEWHTLLDAEPDVVVELLGGLEPARTIVHAALQRGIPVVTANKSLLAVHGAELRAIAAKTATPLAEARSLGFAEPDASQDLDGVDAAEKLVVLLQQFGSFNVALSELETEGTRHISPEDVAEARALGGAIKPVIHADWSHELCAFAAPAFVADRDVLACCELLKDVPGYFTADPKRDPQARPLPAISYARALEMADDGCELVQRHALVAASERQLPLVIHALGSHESPHVS